MTFRPFFNESDSLVIAGLTAENHVDQVAIYGSVTITRDKAGLQRANALLAFLNEVASALKADKSLPDAIAPRLQPTATRDPFAS